MIKIFFIFILIFMPNYGFTFSIMDHIFGKSVEIKKQVPKSDKLIIEIIDFTIIKLKEKYDIHPCGFGLKGDKLEYVEIDFEIFKPLGINEAREILFDCLSELLNNINTNEKIKPYLKKHPLSIRDVGIVFYIQDENHEDLVHPNICVARCTTSGVVFRTNDPEDTYKYKETVEETHEEALALVKKYRAEKGK